MPGQVPDGPSHVDHGTDRSGIREATLHDLVKHRRVSFPHSRYHRALIPTACVPWSRPARSDDLRQFEPATHLVGVMHETGPLQIRSLFHQMSSSQGRESVQRQFVRSRCSLHDVFAHQGFQHDSTRSGVGSGSSRHLLDRPSLAARQRVDQTRAQSTHQQEQSLHRVFINQGDSSSGLRVFMAV